MKLAVDAMGGDYAPKQIVMGAIDAEKTYHCEIVLVGDQGKIEAELKANNAQNLDRLTIHHTTEVIEMGEHPVEAVRKKKDS
ncbi:MAG: phosphate acyltransferase, partial [Anaerovibrio sp.]|nr:phosphate acyltransferase [Anaerovibrio sp.]